MVNLSTAALWWRWTTCLGPLRQKYLEEFKASCETVKESGSSPDLLRAREVACEEIAECTDKRQFLQRHKEL